ncbi:MAG: UDP-2,3-diacylglucosamine diphosphatase LpxI [Holosporales bacterium]|jgi:DUF1009 family protein|nr:UDP-2,3-diacylglucosamine diphosphatase LpxI [Holosporales bacterium]
MLRAQREIQIVSEENEKASDVEACCHRSSCVVALIAGGGDLPLRIIEKLESLKRAYVVVSLEGFGPQNYQQFKIGHIGGILEFIKSAGAKEVLFCGSVKRPSFRSLSVDQVGKRWLRQLGMKALLGDNALLSKVVKLLEKEGLKVIGPQSIIDTLLSPHGILTKAQPSDSDLKDIARGIFILNAMSKADVGQAVVVQEGIALGVEAAEGTKVLLERCQNLKLSSNKGGVLVKLSKIGQEQSVDLPTIGKDTILEVAEANLSGIAVGAGSSQILDFDETVKLADEKSIFIIGV